jgi:NAD(P)-dependent dehydrogenase (short-subunit alcohol dehydrogenase family)
MSERARVVVIGGASGIGAAVAARHRQGGAQVLVWDIADTADVRCDISDPDQVLAAAGATLETLGVPTQVSITAGVGHSGTLLDTPPGDWDRVAGINTRGVWLAMRALAKPMLAGAGGSLVVTSSVSGTLADSGMGLYCASKAALDMLIRVAAKEWAPKLRVNGVAPGVTDTPMLRGAPVNGSWLSGVVRRTTLGRLGTANDIAESIVALHGMSWVNGEILRCDGGLSLDSPISPEGN